VIDEAYTHPASGRTYREEDSAAYFARLAHALRRESEDFIHHYDTRLKGRDYLDQQREWLSDPDRIARAMAHTIAALDKAYTAVTVDRTMHEYGLGKRNEEWERKYGEVAEP
jgi:hypothetical protein